MTKKSDPIFFTIDEIAARWRCSSTHILNLIRADQLEGFRVGRRILIASHEAQAFEENSRYQPAAA